MPAGYKKAQEKEDAVVMLVNDRMTRINVEIVAHRHQIEMAEISKKTLLAHIEALQTEHDELRKFLESVAREMEPE